MSFLTIIIMAVGLAMDCFALSTLQGLSQKHWHPRAVLMAAIFGLFHGLMPLVGYFAGSFFVEWVSRYAPWIALILLSALGIKEIWESFHKKDDAEAQADWTIRHLLTLAFITSVDVLATGVMFVPNPRNLWLGAATFGLVTAIFSIGGYLIGMFFGKRFRFNANLIGGIVLILLGIKIFLEDGGACL